MEEKFFELKKILAKDPNIIALILQGSRGKKFHNEHSDFDATAIITDGIEDTYSEKYKLLRGEGVDISFFSISDLEKYAEFDTEHFWDRYDYAHTEILFDKSEGFLDEILREKGRIPSIKICEVTEKYLDAYINGVFRSVKC